MGCFTSTHRHTHQHTHAHTHALTCTHTHAHTHTHTYTHTRTYARTHARSHAHTNTHMHTHTHSHKHSHKSNTHSRMHLIDAGWPCCIPCPKLQVSFRKRSSTHRALLRKMTYKHQSSYAPLLPCQSSYASLPPYSMVAQVTYVTRERHDSFRHVCHDSFGTCDTTHVVHHVVHVTCAPRALTRATMCALLYASIIPTNYET